MLIILLYHRSFVCRYGNSLSTLEGHFKYLKTHYPVILPYEGFNKGQLNVCLSFDDATYDFYHQVYPLLKTYELKALLAVPVGYIQETHVESPTERMAALADFSFQNKPPPYAFCSFQELKEMARSGYVEIASHGMHHVDLSASGAALDYELTESKKILEQNLGLPINSFVFPYGRYNQESLKQAKKHYLTVMRIGKGLNFSWKDRLHYRVSADQTKDLASLFSFTKKMGYFFKKTLF